MPLSRHSLYLQGRLRRGAAAGEGGSPQSLGSAELGRITAASGGQVHGTTLQIPTTGYHTMGESAVTSAAKTFTRLLAALASIGQRE